MRIRKLLCALLGAVMMTVCITPPGAEAYNFTPYVSNDDGETKPIKIYSEAVYMVNTDTGDVIVDINADEARVPASLTKIMTAVVCLEQFKDDPDQLKEKYVHGDNTAFDELYGTGASTADIQPFEDVCYYDLLCALMLPSSCEAANIIALNISDSIPHFCDLMNEEAQKLGMKNSHFSNAHGLFSKKNYSSCRDMAILTQYALDTFPVFGEIVSKPTYNLPPTDEHPDGTLIVNTNEMLDETSDYYYSPVKGVKTGTLDDAGRCLVSTASMNGKNYMLVTMGAPLYKEGTEEPEYYNLIDHKAIYQWAFYHLVETDFINVNSEITDVKVEFAEEGDSVNLKPADGFKRDWPDNIKLKDIKKDIELYENVVAPVYEGDKLGTLTLSYKGEKLASVDLIATSSVDRSKSDEKVRIAKSFFSSKEFRLCVGGIVFLFVAYTSMFIYKLQHKYVKRPADDEDDEDYE
ncbi:serine hydrolase [Ruminococcus sp. NK3A76]|uniref:D-alanyl-D-alanine carboxypeptidase family protein n=1 Tax=Ruminococcus sp. NK3A76 TaxID=877411 RepID=UPI00068C8EEF|nr:serine hydrolase [Ruminococcus sp. NK3A76]